MYTTSCSYYIYKELATIQIQNSPKEINSGHTYINYIKSYISSTKSILLCTLGSTLTFLYTYNYILLLKVIYRANVQVSTIATCNCL